MLPMDIYMDKVGVDLRNQKLIQALEESKQVTRELHEAIKDARSIHKELKQILIHQAEDLVLSILSHLLPSAIKGAEEKAADNLIKLNEILKEQIHRNYHKMHQVLEEREKEIKYTADRIVDLSDRINKLLNLGEDT